ncbi:HAD family phosphatase [Mesorhizobium sp. CAU 1732]|uniref:HAD family hydrolase n=1 Tax=Mesorhizobium sp. CAU 1732 TaxID=3140358 RepID=UPI0032616AD8
MRPGLVIFDCDGILVDTEETANRVLCAWLTEGGYPVSYEECRRVFSGTSMVSVQQRIEANGHRLGFDLADRWYASIDTIFSTVTAVPHIETVVEALREAGIPWCVASSARVDKMHLTLGATGLMSHFGHALYSATMVERGKPFPDLFLHAAKEMGFDPADCVVIEDSVPGTEAGIAAGMRVFSYAGDPFSDRAALSAAGGTVFDDMRDLPDLILS